MTLEDRVLNVLQWLDERAENSTSYGHHCHAYEVAARRLRDALGYNRAVAHPVGLDMLRKMADRQRGLGMPPRPIVRPEGSNADEWNVFLEEYTGHGNSFIAVQIAEAIEDAERRGSSHLPQEREANSDAR